MFGKRKSAGAILSLLRRSAKLSAGRFAEEIGVDVRLLRVIEGSGDRYMTPQIAEVARSALIKHGVSEASLSVLSAAGATPMFSSHPLYDMVYSIRQDVSAIRYK